MSTRFSDEQLFRDLLEASQHRAHLDELGTKIHYAKTAVDAETDELAHTHLLAYSAKPEQIEEAMKHRRSMQDVVSSGKMTKEEYIVMIDSFQERLNELNRVPNSFMKFGV